MNSRSLWSPRVRTIAIGLLLALVFAALVTVAQAQTYAVIHNFSGGGDGGNPHVGLTMDAAGNFYGTTYNGGNQTCSGGCGIVFRLARSGSSWVLNPIYSFAGGSDGAHPYSRVAIARDGTLYGTTYQGGTGCAGAGCGTVFHLTPSPTAPRTALASWNEEVLYRFTGEEDGANPQGDLALDQAGNIYGTTLLGGSTSCSYGGCGVIYELRPSGRAWTQTVLYSPQLDSSGYTPTGGVILDRSGNLYGVFGAGGQYLSGAVYELSPPGSNWTEQTIYLFTSSYDGGRPVGGLIFDSPGNLYGTTTSGGDPVNENGTAFELSPVNGGWNFNAFYLFCCFTEVDPADKLLIDSAGNLYGTTVSNGNYNDGTVYKLSYSTAGWTSTNLPNFDGSDGSGPMSIVVSDANGNFYGTATWGGTSGTGCSGGFGCGVIWEITQ